MDTPLSVLLNDKGHLVQCVAPNESVRACAIKMNEHKIGALLVMVGGELQGVISERDILCRIVVTGDSADDVTVGDIMTKQLITVLPSTTVRTAMQVVTEKRIRHLPVLDNGHLVGVISIGDLTRWVMLLQEQQINSLQNYIHGNAN